MGKKKEHRERERKQKERVRSVIGVGCEGSRVVSFAGASRSETRGRKGRKKEERKTRSKEREWLC
jgi:hypothetical protein